MSLFGANDNLHCIELTRTDLRHMMDRYIAESSAIAAEIEADLSGRNPVDNDTRTRRRLIEIIQEDVDNVAYARDRLGAGPWPVTFEELERVRKKYRAPSRKQIEENMRSFGLTGGQLAQSKEARA